MDRPVAEQVFAACENVLAELTKIEHTLHGVEDEAERRELMKSLSFVIADVLGTIRAPVVRQFPELLPAEEPGEPDDVLDEEEQGVVATLGPSDLALVDSALMAECVTSWRKSARIVMGAMKVLDQTIPDLPVALFAQRIATLVKSGRLQSQGNLRHLRFSEVKLSESARSAA
jgi:hypothetical protein